MEQPKLIIKNGRTVLDDLSEEQAMLVQEADDLMWKLHGLSAKASREDMPPPEEAPRKYVRVPGLRRQQKQKEEKTQWKITVNPKGM